MRLTATSITLFCLLASGCTPQPTDMRKDLDALKGPQTTSMDDTLKAQAEQEVAGRDYARAAETYRQLVDKNPGNHDYTLALADSLRRAGDNQNALRVIDKYIAANPQDAAAFETRGLCLMSLGSTQDAGKSFEEVMKIDPKRWRTLNAIGILFTMKNKLPEATGYFDEALDNSPGNANVMNNKAITLAMDHKYDEAIDTFMQTRKNVRIGSPDIQQVDMNMALVYAIEGKLDDAERTASPYLSKPALYNNMGVYAELAKSPDLSRSYLNMALTQSPVYYERAWKNLTTVTEDNTSLNEDDLTQATPKKPGKKVKIVTTDPEAGTPLSQIPAPDSGVAYPPNLAPAH